MRTVAASMRGSADFDAAGEEVSAVWPTEGLESCVASFGSGGMAP